MCEILAAVLGRRLERLESQEGPALGAAVTALAALEKAGRSRQGISEPFGVSDAVAAMVRFRDPVEPRPEEVAAYQGEYRAFRERLKALVES